ncbi:hypothetical protein evm_006619 [Chilo suppressalis]|nr:hypothetical protein evm_006619 [Chilo suppressalis]
MAGVAGRTAVSAIFASGLHLRLTSGGVESFVGPIYKKKSMVSSLDDTGQVYKLQASEFALTDGKNADDTRGSYKLLANSLACCFKTRAVAIRLFKDIAKRQRISLAIQRGNAASIFGTLPKRAPKLDLGRTYQHVVKHLAKLGGDGQTGFQLAEMLGQCAGADGKQMSETLQRALSAVRGPSPGAKKLLNIPEDGGKILMVPAISTCARVINTGEGLCPSCGDINRLMMIQPPFGGVCTDPSFPVGTLGKCPRPRDR